VQSLLSFARQHPPERKLANVNALVDGVIEILIYELRTNNIKVEKELSPQLPRLLLDPHQIQQVFLNIVNNARQAIEAHRARGLIRITTSVAGHSVRITFQDDGPGISEENLAKIFNPFFTTKPVGKGTGLGLSLSYGIIQEHGGSITAASKLGHGTTFIIDLPITNQSEDIPAASAPPPPPLAQGKGRKVLVVDDEVDILDLAGKILVRQDYRVQTASMARAPCASGRRAIRPHHLRLENARPERPATFRAPARNRSPIRWAHGLHDRRRLSEKTEKFLSERQNYLARPACPSPSSELGRFGAALQCDLPDHIGSRPDEVDGQKRVVSEALADVAK
jgi:hypothetical protein